MDSPRENPAFVGDDGRSPAGQNGSYDLQKNYEDNAYTKDNKTAPERATWGKGAEFLMSCIAMSIGLGNVWRFPFTALENGGGAFLIPYLIVLLLVGKPIYYLEMIIGQFSSRGSVKVFDVCPAMRGIGMGQALMVFLLSTYYQSLCSTIGFYLVQSFRDPLPWSYCWPEWNASCINSTNSGDSKIVEFTANVKSNFENLTMAGVGSYSLGALKPDNLTRSARADRIISSSELYFYKEVLRERENIDDGIGVPNWELVIGLIVSWICIFTVIRRGVKSSGKWSYFLALFPYVIMIMLLIRAVTLPGSVDGIVYFITPVWSKILDPKVWYAAVTQCFYSLAVCFGNIIMYSSYNRFDHNVHRDAMIVTTLDTFTSLLSGFTIFGILGNLAYETGETDIGSVVKGGVGLAFISYPDAIAKFKTLPQIFSVLFFLMLFVLGIGTNIAMTSCTVTAIRDNFPHIKQWQCSLGIAIVSFCCGLIYITPGGQFMLTLVDYFGASMIALFLGICELYVFGWIYGTDRLCKDVEFMLGRKVGIYWRLCWSVITPLIMVIILIYFLATYTPLTYNNVMYPTWAYAVGWTITSFGILQVPIWIVIGTIRQPGATWGEKMRGAFRPKSDWGPSDALLREQYKKEVDNDSIAMADIGCSTRIRRNIIG